MTCSAVRPPSLYCLECGCAYCRAARAAKAARQSTRGNPKTKARLAEREAQVLSLDALGLTPARLAELLGCSESSVLRTRRALRVQGRL